MVKRTINSFSSATFFGERPLKVVPETGREQKYVPTLRPTVLDEFSAPVQARRCD